MKISRMMLALFVMLAAQPLLHAQHRTADSTVQKLFAALQQKDEQAFLAIYPNANQFGRFMTSIMEQVLKSEGMKAIFATDEKTKNLNIDSLITAEAGNAAGPEKFAAMQAKNKSLFQSTLSKGEAKGVRWSEARITGLTVDSAAVSDKEAAQFNLKGLKEAKGVIDFAVGDSAYQLVFRNMVYFPAEAGWFGADIVQVARKGESLVPAAEETETVTDTISTTFEVVPPPPPPPPAKKQAAKAKQKPAARKTKN